MALISSQQITEAGKTPTLSTPAASDTFTNSGKEFIFVKNGSGGSINITVTAQISSVDLSGYGTLTKSNTVFAVASGASSFVGPFAPEAYSASDGTVTFACSSAESIDVAILYL